LPKFPDSEAPRDLPVLACGRIQMVAIWNKLGR
jgi:hypothetical protein